MGHPATAPSGAGTGFMLPSRLQPGDRVRFVSPASPVPEGGLERATAVLEALGLRVEHGPHVYDVEKTLDYLAGTDEDRVSDFNEALRDSGIKAIIATRGGKGAYRIAHALDVEAARRHPKLVVGFSEITILHMALMKACGLVGIHGAPWDAESFGARSAESFVRAVTTTELIEIPSTTSEHTHELTTGGRATGRLIGGNQDSIATAAGWALPDFGDAILLLEAVNVRLGHIDRQLTMLRNAGILKRVAGVAVGQYTGCGSATDPTSDFRCTEIDVLRDRLGGLGVPVLGGLPIGHGESPVALPIGTMATLDADAGILTVQSGVR
jgi:muramoyltetrapeptide carboxypeptidase